MQKRWYFKKKRNIYFSSRRWTNQTSGRRSGPENIHLDTAASNTRRKSPWFSWRIRRVSSTSSRLVSGCRWSDKWFSSMSGNFLYLHHVEPRVKLYSPREESFPVPLKYIDVSRTTHTNLDVKQERRIDDYWKIDGSRDLSDYWTGFAQFTLLEENPLWSGERLTRKQLTSRPDYLWPELWTKLGRNAQLKERQKWSMKNHNSIMPDNYEVFISLTLRTRNKFKETIKNVRKKLETPVAPAMLCKMSKNNQNWVTHGKSNEIKSKLACILKASESTRLRVGESLPNHHEDHIAGKNGTIHCSITIWFTNLFLCLKPWKFLQQRQRWTRNGTNWRKFRRGTWRKSEVRKKWSMKQGRKAQKFILPHWWTCVIWKMLNWRQSTKHTKVELYSEVILWKMILGLTQYSPNKDHQHL